MGHRSCRPWLHPTVLLLGFGRSCCGLAKAKAQNSATPQPAPHRALGPGASSALWACRIRRRASSSAQASARFTEKLWLSQLRVTSRAEQSGALQTGCLLQGRLLPLRLFRQGLCCNCGPRSLRKGGGAGSQDLTPGSPLAFSIWARRCAAFSASSCFARARPGTSSYDCLNLS